MTIIEMLDLIALLGIGELNNDNDQKTTSLKYLNLAHAELYRATANINPNVFFSETLANVAGEDFITLSFTPFLIINVFPIGQTMALEGMSLAKFADYKFKNPFNGLPRFYANQRTHVSIYPLQTDNSVYTFLTTYAVDFTPFTMATLEADIPYPLTFHNILVDGALYYLFQDESGFKNTQKMTEALTRWKSGKAEVFAYFYNSTKERIGTYSNL